MEKIEGIHPVKVRSTANNIDAELIMNLLDNNNIPCFKKSKAAGDYLNIYMGFSVYGEDIYVDEKDYETAMDLLAGFYEDQVESVVNEKDKQEYSVPFYKNSGTLVRMIIIVAFVGFLMVSFLASGIGR